MAIRITFICSILLALASCPLTGFADTLYLKNGRKVEGRVVARDFPPQCRGFLQSEHTKLIGVWGSYDPNRESPRWITSVAFSPDGAFVLSGGAAPGPGHLESGSLKLWSVASGREVRVFQGHTRRVNSVAFSPDGRFALSGSTDGTVRLWAVATGEEVRTLKEVKNVEYRMVDAVAFSPDGNFVLVGTSEEPGLRLLDGASGEELRTFNVGFGVRSIAFSPEGRLALSASSYEPPTLWEVASGKLVRAFRMKRGRWLFLLKSRGAWSQAIFSPDGQLVAAGNSDSNIRLWDAATGEELLVFQGHNGRVSSVAFSPDGRLLISGGSEDHTIRFWNAANGEQVDRIDLTTSNDLVYTLAFAPDGGSFVAGTDRGVILHFELVND